MERLWRRTFPQNLNHLWLLVGQQQSSCYKKTLCSQQSCEISPIKICSTLFPYLAWASQNFYEIGMCSVPLSNPIHSSLPRALARGSLSLSVLYSCRLVVKCIVRKRPAAINVAMVREWVILSAADDPPSRKSLLQALLFRAPLCSIFLSSHQHQVFIFSNVQQWYLKKRIKK